MEQINPYLPPQTDAHPHVSDPNEVRRLHLEHESGLKGLGLFMVLVGLAMVWGAGVSLAPMLKNGASLAGLAGSGAWFFIGLCYLIIGPGLRGLRQWAHRAAVAVEALACVITLLGPDPTIGFIFHAAVGLALLGRKTRRVVTPEYRRIIAETPTAKKGTSSVAWALLALLALLLAGGLATALWQRYLMR